MRSDLSRRDIVFHLPGAAFITGLMGAIPSAIADENSKSSRGELWPEFPRQNPNVVREIVGASHSNEARVRELLDQHPALVNAWWDWGYGDWESPLGAASHVGRRNIALLLIERRARMDIFAAAMLGQTEIVKDFVASNPGIQQTLGPHGIPLLRHAGAGGEEAKETFAYLESLGDAGNPPKTAEMPSSIRDGVVGTYKFGDSAGDVFEVKFEKEQLKIIGRNQTSPRLNYIGDDTFFPAGVPSVKIRFEMKESRAASLMVLDHDLRIVGIRSN